MGSIKISQLPEQTTLDSNLSNTYVAVVDVPSKSTVKITADTLSNSIYTDTVTRLSIVNIRDYGAVGKSGVDDTVAIQAAINYVYSLGGGTVFIPSGVYRCRDVQLYARVNLIGEGPSASKLRFFPSGDPATDATLYVLHWRGSFSVIQDLTIDGNGLPISVGNGLLISADSSGFHRRLIGCDVQWFAGYNPSPTGGSYGINRNYANTDIVTGSSTLLTGGHAVFCGTSPTGSELIIDRCNIGSCDGYGLFLGSTHDSKISNTNVANAMYMGIALTHANKNHQWTNIKVYTCRRLNPREYYTIVPFTGISSDAYGAITLTGAGHIFENVESNENGSHGFYLGTNNHSLAISKLGILADGNGGYIPGDTSNSSYQRYGVMAYNYYALDIKLTANDFRAWNGTARQSRAIHAISSTPTFTSLTADQASDFVTIGDNSGGADFTTLQSAISAAGGTPSNAVGTIFQVSIGPDGNIPTTNFGTGWLTGVKSHCNYDITFQNQVEQLSGTGEGYNLDFDLGISSITVNGNRIGHVTANNDIVYQVRRQGELGPRLNILGDGTIQWGSGIGNADVAITRLSSNSAGTRSSQSWRCGNGAWNTGHLLLGAYHIWVDASGRLRIKSTTPTSDTDGNIIGTQS